jgi:hypothetical protein
MAHRKPTCTKTFRSVSVFTGDSGISTRMCRSAEHEPALRRSRVLKPSALPWTMSSRVSIRFMCSDLIAFGESVRFTDGTSFCFQLIHQVALRVEYLESRRDQLELLKDYGEVSGGKREHEVLFRNQMK